MFNSFKNNISSERAYTQWELLELERQEKALSEWRKEEAERKKKKRHWRWQGTGKRK